MKTGKVLLAFFLIMVIINFAGCGSGSDDAAAVPPEEVAELFVQSLLENDIDKAVTYCNDPRIIDGLMQHVDTINDLIEFYEFNYEKVESIVFASDNEAVIDVVSDTGVIWFKLIFEKIDSEWKIVWAIATCCA